MFEYLFNADERLRCHHVEEINRCPLIIDPSGQATTFICNEYKDRKITRTR